MSGNRTIAIAGRVVGAGHPPYIVAEMSGNHQGDLSRALAILRAAKEAGADALKLQTYTADTMTIDHSGPGFDIEGGLWDGMNLYQLYRQAHTPWDWHRPLFDEGRRLGITVFSTPFDGTAVDFLEELDAPAYKIASFELVDLPLIRRAAATGKPLIMSTGMAEADEIKEAVAAARQSGCGELALLHCVSGYPTSPDDCNLRTIPSLAAAFDVVVGLSDHTLGVAASVAAVALGAAVIEKHLTLRRADGGTDAGFSLEPEEFGAVVEGCRTAWRALGHSRQGCLPGETQSRIYRRSLYVVRDIGVGEKLSMENVRAIRPGFGLAPKHLPKVVGRRAKGAIRRGTPLSWDLIDGADR